MAVWNGKELFFLIGSSIYSLFKDAQHTGTKKGESRLTASFVARFHISGLSFSAFLHRDECKSGNVEWPRFFCSYRRGTLALPVLEGFLTTCFPNGLQQDNRRKAWKKSLPKTYTTVLSYMVRADTLFQNNFSAN